MKYLLIAAVSIWLYQSSFYSLHFNRIEGGEQHLSAFQGKKVLLVNIATGSTKVGQLAALNQLQQQFKDSLVIVAFPSNSFGHELRDNAGIRQFCDSAYQVGFAIAQKGDVKGPSAQPVYQWLTHKEENGAGSVQLLADFQKCLIDSNGELIGVFAGSVSPLDQKIIQAIEQ